MDLLSTNSAIFSKSGGSQGIGFAIPETLAKQVMEQIIKQGSVTRGWIGVSMRDMNPEIARAYNLPNVKGTLVVGVLRGSPADRAGVQPGDIITGINGKPLPGSSATLNYIAQLAPGAQVQVTVARGARRNQAPHYHRAPPATAAKRWRRMMRHPHRAFR